MKNTAKKPLSSAIFAIAFAMTLTSCVSLGGDNPPPALLTLTAAQTPVAGSTQSGEQRDALVILLPEVPRKLDTNRIPVQIDASSIAYIKDAVWADKPARLMQDLLVQTITAQNGRLILNEADAGGKAAEFLSGSLVEFGVDAASSEAVIIYDAVKLIRGKAVEKRRFETRKTVYKVEASETGEALNEAANEIAQQVASWLG